jgi:chromosomal replication initiation ATPase DnaA
MAFSKTHATVLHAYKTINGRLDVDNQLRQEVEFLIDKLGGMPA